MDYGELPLRKNPGLSYAIKCARGVTQSEGGT